MSSRETWRPNTGREIVSMPKSRSPPTFVFDDRNYRDALWKRKRVINSLIRIRTSSFRRNPAADRDFFLSVIQNKWAERFIYVKIFQFYFAQFVVYKLFVIDFLDFTGNLACLKIWKKKRRCRIRNFSEEIFPQRRKGRKGIWVIFKSNVLQNLVFFCELCVPCGKLLFFNSEVCFGATSTTEPNFIRNFRALPWLSNSRSAIARRIRYVWTKSYRIQPCAAAKRCRRKPLQIAGAGNRIINAAWDLRNFSPSLSAFVVKPM